MEHPHFTVAFTGNPQTGKDILFRNLTAGKWFGKTTARPGVSYPNGSFFYASCRYGAVELPGVLSLSSPTEEAGCTAEYICSGKADIIALTGHALQLEDLLRLLKEIISLDQVKDGQIPVVLCVSCCDEAEQHGIIIDFTLLHDVLQIPIVPLHGFGREQMDDLKAAFHYSVQPRHRREFLYDCLDFSPGKLARECILVEQGRMAQGCVVQGCINQERMEQDLSKDREWESYQVYKRSSPSAPAASPAALVLLLASVFWITCAWSGWFMERLWPVLFMAKANLAAWCAWAGLPAWLTGCVVHGAFGLACRVLLVMLPPLGMLFPLLGLLENAGYLPRSVFLPQAGSFQQTGSLPQTWFPAVPAALILILSIIAIRPETLPIAWAFPPALHLPFSHPFHTWLCLPQPYMVLRMFCCLLAGGAALLAGKATLPAGAVTRRARNPRRSGIPGAIFRSTACLTLPILNSAVLAAVPAGIIIWLLGSATHTGSHSGSLALLCPGPYSISLLPVSHGWTIKTALCTFIFTLFHWPGLTLCLNIHRQNGSVRKAAAALLVPSAIGVALCAAAAIALGKVGL